MSILCYGWSIYVRASVGHPGYNQLLLLLLPLLHATTVLVYNATAASAIHLSVDVVGPASRNMGQPGHYGGSAGSSAAAGPGGGVFPGLPTARVHALQLRGTATQAVKAATCDGQALSAISAADAEGCTQPGVVGAKILRRKQSLPCRSGASSLCALQWLQQWCFT